MPIKTTGTKSKVRVLKVLLAAFGIIVFAVPKPPKESKLLQNFYTNRAAFEQLRDMLRADNQVIVVDDPDVFTTIASKFPILSNFRVPPDGNLPVARYEKYLALLKQVGGQRASRTTEPHPSLNVLVWIWGWAGG